MPKRPTNWPAIILISLGVIVAILLIIFVVVPAFSGGSNQCPSDYPREICDKYWPDAVPNCQADSFNCESFDTQEGAQWVYDFCADYGYGDVHNLDPDGDGVVCEDIPNVQPSAGETVPAGSGTYNCDTDTYNCADFETQAEAQAVYDYCDGLGFGDVHRLDADGDGVVCESLP
jgi:hypothetical protein